ncbi:bacillithiol system redox-active protein YtxJ [Elizabethkingia sp. JS20170427COW]|uniref:bacillithiol system redox-active protein YtxJ n=1 Tax=Elizabethkingia sp. JS20170427COW TaxID=2583851 RepID=UPI0011102590|nr:bacillithiol system redox-active protein YtxJ [Elizabethkingia sp. JS20170427COW]QCX53869.1 bacillithiol system redox-active protein YtxJ [Elizabethkingia sp. JS20170427COW]
MSFFNFFGSNEKEELPSFWNILTSEEELYKAVEESKEHWVLIFKHSTRCPISSRVLRNFERDLEAQDLPNYRFYYLDLLKYRALSNKIADDFGVAHQSPQVIVLKNEKSVYDASHHSIQVEALPE